MGDNAAFTAFEAIVIATYNAGVLDKELLSDFMEVYRGTDIDPGGICGILSQDGLAIEEVVLKTFGVKMKARPELPVDHQPRTSIQDRLSEEYHDWLTTEFCEISDKFGWR